MPPTVTKEKGRAVEGTRRLHQPDRRMTPQADTTRARCKSQKNAKNSGFSSDLPNAVLHLNKRLQQPSYSTRTSTITIKLGICGFERKPVGRSLNSAF